MRRMGLVLGLLGAGCVFSTGPDLGGLPMDSMRLEPGLAVAAHAELRQDTVVVLLTFTNTGSAEATAEFGACTFAVEGIGVGHSWNNGLPRNALCPGVGYSITAPGGQSRDRVVFHTTAASLRQTGGARPYRVRVTYRERETERLRELDAGTVVF